MASAVIHTRENLSNRNEARYDHSGYRETHALLIHWEDDDLKARSDLRTLGFVLRDNYAVTTRLISLPSRDYIEKNASMLKESDRTFEREIAEFLRLYAAPDILLIVIYLGHGIYDDNLKFTLSGFSKDKAKEQRKPIPKLDWSVPESGVITSASDVMILLDLRGDLGDEIPPVLFDTSMMTKQPSINELIISYSGPGTPGDTGKSFAYTKILRDYLRNMGTTPRVMLNEAHNHIVDHINRAADHGGLAFPPLRHCLSDIDKNIPLVTFDLTEPCADILRGSGDYKWGPLGRLPLGWEKAIDNNDQYWRPYFKDNNTGKKHATRPWSTAFRADERELWDASRFAEASMSHVLHRMGDALTSDTVDAVLQREKEGEWVTAWQDFLTWTRSALQKREEVAREQSTQEEVARKKEVHQREELARKQEAVKLQELQELQQQEALQQLENLRLQETARKAEQGRSFVAPKFGGLGQSIYASDSVPARRTSRAEFAHELPHSAELRQEGSVQDRGRKPVQLIQEPYAHPRAAIQNQKLDRERNIAAASPAREETIDQQPSVQKNATTQQITVSKPNIREQEIQTSTGSSASAWQAFVSRQARR